MARSTASPPPRRPVRALRVRSRFTPTRSSVYRREPDAPPREPVAPTVVEPAVEPAVVEPAVVDTGIAEPASPVTGPATETPVDTDAAEAERLDLETMFALPDAVTPAAAPRTRGSGRLVTVVLGVVAVAALSVVAGVAAGRDREARPPAAIASPSSAVRGPAARAAVPAGLGEWLTAGAADRLVVDDTATASVVSAAGATPAAVGLTQARAGDRVLRAVPAGAVDAVVSGAAGTAVVPVEVFGGAGSSSLVAGLAIGGSPPAVTQARAAVSDTARSASAALGRNAAVTFTPAARAVLDTDVVDLRVTAFVVALANAQPVQVSAFTVDAGERDAGVPVRTVTVSSAAAGAVADLAAAARGAYRPVSVTPAAGGGSTLTWSVQPDPTGITVR